MKSSVVITRGYSLTFYTADGTIAFERHVHLKREARAIARTVWKRGKEFNHITRCQCAFHAHGQRFDVGDISATYQRS